MKILFTLSMFLLLFSCNTKKENTPKQQAPALNISVFVDLSDRLTRSAFPPSQMSRDTAIIAYLTDYFKKQTSGPQILNSQNSIKVFFYPTPNIPEINTLAQGLSIEIAALKGVEKTMALKDMKTNFLTNLSQIYNVALQQQNFIGCDIWDFFSNKKVDQLCIRPNARNIIVILTDGYLYHADNKQQEGNAYSYVLPQTLTKANSSLITKRQGLENLEVLMLEVNPYTPAQRDPLIHILEKWFHEMGVKRFLAVETDLPTTIQPIIKNFLEN